MGCLFIISILCVSFLFNAVWSDCDRMKGPFGLTDCVRSPFFPKFQAAICLSKRMIEMSTSKRVSCKGGNTKFCWYLCSATFTEGGHSVCKCDPGSKNQDKSDTPNVHCYFPKGGCSWYTKCLANKKDCPSIKKMENKCSELENISKKLSEKGYSFLKFMKSCIQKKLVHVLYPQVYMDCGKMKSKIEFSTQMCLRESGKAVRYCDLEWADILKIGTLFQGIFNHLKICGSTPYLPPWAKILEFSLKESSEKDIDYLASETGLTLSHSFKWKETGLSFMSVCPNTFNRRKKLIPIRIYLYSESKNDAEVEKAIKTVTDYTRRGNMVKLTLKKGTSVDVTRVIGCSNPLCRPKHFFSLQTEFTSFKLPSYFHWHPWDIYEQANHLKRNLIDSWDKKTQDSPIAFLLQTMIFYDRQGKPQKPIGINPAARKSFECKVKGPQFYPQNQSNRRKKRNYARNAKLWKDGKDGKDGKVVKVPYVKYPDFSDSMKEAIRIALDTFKDLTCVQFEEIEEPEDSQSYIYINTGDSCSSLVGRQSGKQEVTLADPGCDDARTVVHELMHALGQEHEQSRSDRNEYIDVFCDNIINDAKYNFDELDTLNLTPYDAESVMHYGLKDFAVNEFTQTLSLKDRNLNSIVGVTETLSFYDIQDITKAYNCAGGCDTLPLCQNGGFVIHTCKCLCPTDLEGGTCNKVKTDKDCGGFIDLKSKHFFELEPASYRKDRTCVWMIRAPIGSRIQLKIYDIDLLYDEENRKCYHWLEIRYNLVGQTGIRLCNSPQNQMDRTFTTTDDGNSNMMILKFDSTFTPRPEVDLSKSTVTPRSEVDLSKYRGYILKAEIIEVRKQSRKGGYVKSCVTEGQ